MAGLFKKRQTKAAGEDVGSSTEATPINSLSDTIKFRVVESYKALRTNLMFSVIHGGCKCFVISSSMPSEGKSTISVNTAIALAQTESRVLLIDTDLRKPKVNRFFGISGTPGLSNYLIGANTLDEVLNKTSYPNLTVLCSGSRVPNPSELLASEQMESLLSLLKSHFDYIILDSAPLNVVSDTYPLIKKTDGVLLVVYENRSDYKELDKTLKSLDVVGAKVLGFVMNGVKTGTKKSYYSRGKYGYGDYYGGYAQASVQQK